MNLKVCGTILPLGCVFVRICLGLSQPPFGELLFGYVGTKLSWEGLAPVQRGDECQMR